MAKVDKRVTPELMKALGLEGAEFRVTHRDLVESSVRMQADELRRAVDYAGRKQVLALARSIIATIERQNPMLAMPEPRLSQFFRLLR
jgi:hypothetical protein